MQNTYTRCLYSLIAAAAVVATMSASRTAIAQSPATPVNDAIAALIEVLKMPATAEPLESARTVAAEALGEIPAAAPKLIELVDDKTQGDAIRLNAIRALGLIGNKVSAADKPTAIKALTSVMKEVKGKEIESSYLLLAVESLGNLCS